MLRVMLAVVLFGLPGIARGADDFPPPDAAGGWRALTAAADVRREAGLDPEKLDEAFEYVKRSTKHGGLLVVRRGWLVYERYFGRGHREATPNTASVGKALTSMAVGILIHRRADLFPHGLDQRVMQPAFLPPEAFPLSDPAKAEIKLGQLLAMTAGIRGSSPGMVRGRPVPIDPPGPEGWLAMVDPMALGKMEGAENAITLWTPPGGGYSYATASVHLTSIILRHVTGQELEAFVGEHLAQPMGWGAAGLRVQERAPAAGAHPGGGGTALRARDMLRFGQLLLRQGRWGAAQLVPSHYVEAATTRSPFNPHYPASLPFEVNFDGRVAGVPRDAFWMSGSGGHSLYVVPSLDLVVYKLGGRGDQYHHRQTGLPPLPKTVFEYETGPGSSGNRAWMARWPFGTRWRAWSRRSYAGSGGLVPRADPARGRSRAAEFLSGGYAGRWETGRGNPRRSPGRTTTLRARNCARGG